MSSTQLESQPPVNLFSSNWASMSLQNRNTEAPAEQENRHSGLTGLFDRMASAKIEGYKPDPSKEIRVSLSENKDVDRERIANDAQANGNILRQTDAQIIPRDETGTQTALRHLNQAVGEAVQRMGITSILGDELKDAQQARQSAEMEQKIQPPVMAGPTSMSLG